MVAQQISLMITKNNRGVLITSFAVGGIFLTALENELVKCFKMVMLKLNVIGSALQYFILL